LERIVNIDAYNKLCDKIRSSILYAESLKKKNEKRKMIIQDLIEVIYRNETELIRRVKSLEESVDHLCNETKNENSSEKCNYPS